MLLERYSSQFWFLKEVDRLVQNADVHCVSFSILEDGKPIWFSLIHNFKQSIFAFLAQLTFSGEANLRWPPKLVLALVLGIKAGLSSWESLQFPVGQLEQETWMLQSLLHSTKGFARPGVAARVCDDVQAIVTTMQRGR